MERERQIHPFAPVCDAHSRVLILGSFPSVKSRKNAFYYGHPQNRFWRVLAEVFDEDAPQTIAHKQAFLLRHHLALWDVIGDCEIAGSSDSSIRRAAPNDLEMLLAKCPVKVVLLNGKTAEKVFLRFWKDLHIPYYTLPSTSSANAAWTLDKLAGA